MTRTNKSKRIRQRSETQPHKGKSKISYEHAQARYHQIAHKIKPIGKRIQVYTHGETEPTIVLNQRCDDDA